MYHDDDDDDDGGGGDSNNNDNEPKSVVDEIRREPQDGAGEMEKKRSV